MRKITAQQHGLYAAKRSGQLTSRGHAPRSHSTQNTPLCHMYMFNGILLLYIYCEKINVGPSGNVVDNGPVTKGNFNQISTLESAVSTLVPLLTNQTYHFDDNV